LIYVLLVPSWIWLAGRLVPLTLPIFLSSTETPLVIWTFWVIWTTSSSLVMTPLPVGVTIDIDAIFAFWKLGLARPTALCFVSPRTCHCPSSPRRKNFAGRPGVRVRRVGSEIEIGLLSCTAGSLLIWTEAHHQ